MNIKFKVLVIVTILSNDLLHASMVKFGIARPAVSAAAKASTSFSRIPVIAPLSWGSTRSVNTVPKNTSLFFESSGGAKSKKLWWIRLNKAIKALVGLGIINTGYDLYQFLKIEQEAMAEIRKQSAIEKQKILSESDDLAVIDPEFYEVCLEIKNDYGISENIDFRVAHSGINSFTEKFSQGVVAMYLWGFGNIIVFRSDYKEFRIPSLIRLTAHELEHYRQYHEYSGSFHGYLQQKKEKNISRRLEIGAEAASAGYQYCSECLRSQHGVNYELEDTKEGYFTSPLGYFTDEDLKLYADQAKNDCALCLAHQQFKDAHLMKDIPLKKFLPVMKPSLPSVKK